MLVLIDGLDLNSEAFQQSWNVSLLRPMRGRWARQNYADLLGDFDRSVAGEIVVWLGGWTGEPGLSPGVKRQFDFYLGRALMAGGIKVGIERGWCQENPIAGGWDYEIATDGPDVYDIIADNIMSRPSWRPTEPSKFVGNCQGKTMFLTSDRSKKVPFSTPAAFNLLAADHDYLRWGFATTACAPFRLRSAELIVCTSSEAYDWAKIQVPCEPTVMYDRTLDVLKTRRTELE